jgi:hypothetical protein
MGGAATVMLILPGLALLLLLPAASRTGAGRLDLLFLAPALSIGVHPLLIVLTGLLGLRLGPMYAWLPAVLAATAIALRLWRARPALFAWIRVMRRPSPEQLALIGVVAMIVFSRLWAIRALDAPMWGDSYQHSVLTQLLLDHNGLFDDWRPYVEMTSLTYHIGFHSVSAVFGWLTGLPGAQAVLWMGQFLNIAAVLALYPLARRMTTTSWAGVVAVGFAGLVSTHPGFYLNWGRYTQLAGQVVLPGVIWLVWTTIARAREPARSRVPIPLIIITAIAWAGLGLAHYRILILGVVFALVFFPIGIVLMRSRRWGLSILLAGAALGALLFMPWFARTFSGTLPQNTAQALVTPAALASEQIVEYNGVLDPFVFLPQWTQFVTALICLIALWRRNWLAIGLALWWLAIALATNPNMLGLPGAGVITNFALAILSYLPMSLLLASSVPEKRFPDGTQAAGFAPRAVRFATFAFGCAVALAGARDRIADIHPDRMALYLRPDARAAEWIRTHVIPNAKFLVHSYPINHDTLISGSDGGWWLPLATGRSTTQPPVNYSMERPPYPDYMESVRELPALVRRSGLTSGVMERLKREGITHIYFGQLHSGDDYNLVPAALDEDSRLRRIYRQDRVSIYELLP